MIVDTSAILAILLEEPEAERFLSALEIAPAPRMSAGARIELESVSTRRFRGALDGVIELFLSEFQLLVVPVTGDQALIGRDAYRRYGIGTGHPARLNFGDCFSYALAKAVGEPLLFRGDDFIHTDVRNATG